MPISTISGDSDTKTLTLKDVRTRCLRMCGSEENGKVRADIDRWINDTVGEILTDVNQEWQLAQHAFQTVAKYETGQVTVTKGSTTFTLSGGGTLSSDHVGRKMMVAGEDVGYPIDSRTDPSTGELLYAYMGESGTKDFKIVQDTYDLASDFDQPQMVEQHFSSLRLQVLRHLPVTFKVSSQPLSAAITPDKKIRLYPAPDRVMHCVYNYYREFSALSSDADIIQVPDRHIQVVVDGVAEKYWSGVTGSKEGLKKAEWFRKRYEAGKAHLLSHKYTRDAQLVQFTPYDQPGVVSADYEWSGFRAVDLIQ